jgi:DeoR/GlpR family transcriptional regulator of sugar metabolism
VDDDRPVLRASRLAAIRDLLAGGEAVTTSELTRRLGVSEATVRRDLDALQASGVAQRTHGGAIAVSRHVQEAPLPQRTAARVAEKRAIGRAAAALVGPGDTVFIGGGSTTLALAAQLAPLRLTVVTNSLPVAVELSHAPAVDVVVIGGTLRIPEMTMVGPRAVEGIRGYRARWAFLGAPALDVHHGLTADGDAEAATDEAFLAMAQRAVVLADHTKLGRVSTTFVAALSAIDVVVTDPHATAETVAALREAGPDVLVADDSTTTKETS